MNIKNIPNILSALRLAFIPLFILSFAHGKTALCAIIFIISGMTDVADGFIARRFSAESHLGRILDPIADKLTYATAFFCLCADGKIPAFFTVGFTAVQLCQGIGALLIYKYSKTVVKSNIPGKAAGFSMFALCILNLIFYDIIGNAELINLISAMVLALLICTCAVYFLQYFDFRRITIQDQNKN
ncbi:MAG: CDP-alcohol phosphatidyltransferase family protein [Clostridia bacterium]|nr:CDP-alcohol phosphatidyltransferase family protein [Clostridia bacterium]